MSSHNLNTQRHSPWSPSSSPVYHERQSLQLCALHALNNLFQDGRAFSRTQLDEICSRLSPDNLINPHKSLLGLGNYDINVIMAALESKNHAAVWFDKRKDVDILDLDQIYGFVLNIPTDYEWGFIRIPLKRRHWTCVKAIQGLYYNLDSKLEYPELIGKDTEVSKYLKDQIGHKDKELFVVVSKEVEETKAWNRSVQQQKQSQHPHASTSAMSYQPSSASGHTHLGS